MYQYHLRSYPYLRSYNIYVYFSSNGITIAFELRRSVKFGSGTASSFFFLCPFHNHMQIHKHALGRLPTSSKMASRFILLRDAKKSKSAIVSTASGY